MISIVYFDTLVTIDRCLSIFDLCIYLTHCLLVLPWNVAFRFYYFFERLYFLGTDVTGLHIFDLELNFSFYIVCLR